MTLKIALDFKRPPSPSDFVLVDKKDTQDNMQTQALTFNIACLPSIPGWFQVNSNELRPNAERVEQIANFILAQDEKGQGHDIVAFQEAWDIGNRDFLQKMLDAEQALFAKAQSDSKFNAAEHTKAADIRIKQQLKTRFKAVTEFYKKHHHRKGHKLEQSVLQKHITWCDDHYKQFETKLDAHSDCMKKWLQDRIKEMSEKSLDTKLLQKPQSAAKDLKDSKTSTNGIYTYCSKDAGQKLLNGGSGLLVFSKYEAISTTFIPFKDVSPGIEDLANKGFLAIEFKVPYSDKPLLFMTAHFSGGSDKGKLDLIAEGLGTTSTIRSHQADQIRQYVQSNVLDDNGQPKYCNVVITGDFNDPYNTPRQFQSVSTGMTKTIREGGNGMPEGVVKYNGRRGLWELIDQDTAFPIDVLDVRALPVTKGAPKLDNPQLLQLAINEKLKTGTTYDSKALEDNLTDPKKNPLELTLKSERKRFDVAVQVNKRWVSQSGSFQSSVVDLTTTLPNYVYSVSDHAPTQLFFKPAPQKTKVPAPIPTNPTTVLSK